MCREPRGRLFGNLDVQGMGASNKRRDGEKDYHHGLTHFGFAREKTSCEDGFS